MAISFLPICTIYAQKSINDHITLQAAFFDLPGTKKMHSHTANPASEVNTPFGSNPA
jgi:hypothetical protein